MLLNEKVGVATMDTTTTMGDRILTLMRRRGRDDRGREYEQRELVAMLNGDIVAPDGRFYNISTSATAISRLIGGDLTRPSLEILDAICSMFDSDMEWIVRGRTLEAKGAIEVFITEEANQAGSLVDSMSEDMRAFVLDIVRKVFALDQERKSLQEEVFELLNETMPAMPGKARQRARSIVGKIHGRGFGIDRMKLN